MIKRLWGDQFYDPKERKWTKTPVAGSVRGFCQFVLDPIYKVRGNEREGWREGGGERSQEERERERERERGRGNIHFL